MTTYEEALSGSVALVTGGSRGIGRATCIALAKRGATVAINFVSREDAAKETASLVEKHGGKSVLCRFDVSNGEEVDAAIAKLAKDEGGLHILVNNAGVAINGLLMRFKPEDWERTIAVNLSSLFHCSKAATRHLLKAKERGRVINISSVVGEMGNGGQAAYSASKAGMIGFTKSLAKELSGRGVTVNVVSPGYVDTDMTAAELPAEARERLLKEIPLGRVCAPEEIASSVAFLAGPEAGYITGQVLRVNGGLLT